MTDTNDSEALDDVNSPTEDDISRLQEQVQKLEKEKKELEADFGVKFAKFKELFLQKEAELRQKHDYWEQSRVELEKLKSDMGNVRQELEDVKTAAAMSEQAKQDEIASVRQQYEQEISSMQQLLGEASAEAQMSTAAQYETERMNLVKLNEKYEEEIQDLRNKLSQEREGFLVSVAKSLRRVGGVSGPSTFNISTEHENLEDSMRKAQEDTQLLKSVVLPLEEEIKTLREQLQKAQEQLRESGIQSADGKPEKKSPTLADLDNIADPREKVDKLMKYLKAEKAARIDLEMYVAVLTTQKNVLQEDTEKVRKELHEVCRLLEEEKQAHEALKQTWQMANDQFLESQRLMMMDMRRMESVLSAEQQRQIAELQQKDQEREAQEKKVKELGERRERQEREQAERRKQSFSQSDQGSQESSEYSRDELNLYEKSKSQSKSSLTSSNSDDIGHFDAVDDGGMRRSQSSSELPSLAEEKLASSAVHETRSLSDVDGIIVRISPEKVLTLQSASLTAAQTKAITDPTPEVEARKNLLAAAKAKSDHISLEGKRLVSEREWHLLQEEIRLAREKLGRPCSMCSNYEAQLQAVQEDLKNTKKESKRLERLVTHEQQAAENALKYQIQLEEALKVSAEEAQTEVTNLTTKVTECEKYINGIKSSFTHTQLQLQDQLKLLSENRLEVQKELTKLQDENDNLLGKHSKTAQQLQNEDINLPNNLEEMQLLLLKYREEIIAAKVAKEHSEETLKSEQVFLRSQLLSEQEEKQRMEDTLSQEISLLQAKASLLDRMKADLERESSQRAEFETKLREAETSLKSIQAKSKQLIGALQQRVEESEKAKTQAEEDIQKLRGKIQSLQVDLDNSEAVQRDFVKLSQSLQIQLEKIRQAETEVRWQHEDDVEDCNNCRLMFSVTKRKHHCRHCGRIFCADCITKSVNSGPMGRPAKVCDVCHTILVKDATPYFSREPPVTPD
ncbi:rab GTPase-binding effector protein 1-like isoform X1 [Pomacea canaliculata]|uniref:rab GTPase-binding effector protein 1-like isoform X1 n=1 Tax=Pomacea canaliculata TaxID=400727 RepID=UPI000D72DA5E|nr:rab GTPase-binding effector protein 1-like isoform X1 [Pomacea canaliculata]